MSVVQQKQIIQPPSFPEELYHNIAEETVHFFYSIGCGSIIKIAIHFSYLGHICNIICKSI